MANAGVPFDIEGWAMYLEQVVEAEILRASEKLKDLAPDHPEGKSWSWNSPQQVKKVFALEGKNFLVSRRKLSPAVITPSRRSFSSTAKPST